MSTREIAEQVGVSQAQVHTDLKEAGEQGCSPLPAGSTVNGKGGEAAGGGPAGEEPPA
jgi:hypothetical protein